MASEPTSVMPLAGIDAQFDRLDVEAPSVKPRMREQGASARRASPSS
jgi:hypothetical protein